MLPEFDYQIGAFTATSAVVVTSGSEADWTKHFLLRSGQIEPEPPNWAMQAGSHMEPLILNWFEQKLGHPITRRGEVIDHPDIPGGRCKLDGYCAPLDAVIEAKFLSGARQQAEFSSLYYPQTRWQRMCSGARRAILLVAQGTAEPIDIDHDHIDADFDGELLKRADIFLNCLRTLTPPYPLPPVIPPEKWRTVDIVAAPTNWSAELCMYLQEYSATADAAATHEAVGKAARDLIPDDVGKVLAGDFQISRNRRGVLSITRRAA